MGMSLMSSARFCEVTTISWSCAGATSPSPLAALSAARPARGAATARNAKRCAASGEAALLVTEPPAPLLPRESLELPTPSRLTLMVQQVGDSTHIARDAYRTQGFSPGRVGPRGLV